MSIYTEKSRRRVIPRWRPATVAGASKDFKPLRPVRTASVAAQSTLPQLLHDFDRSRDLGLAAEILSAAAVEGKRDAALDAAQFVLDSQSQAPETLTHMARTLIVGGDSPFADQELVDIRPSIARLRALLRFNPRSAALWADLARLQAAIGRSGRALRSMQTALSLAPRHRWLLRVANRLFLHLSDPQRAHDLLLRNPGTPRDPWLIAAEIATAQVRGTTPKFMRQARDFIRHKSLAPVHLSELASAIATTDLEAGARKSAMRLLGLAIKDPTENALAQIEWAARSDGNNLDVGGAISHASDAYEAAAWLKYHDGALTDALAQAEAWLKDEPFASRPASMACHIAGLLDDYAKIESITKRMMTRLAARHSGAETSMQDSRQRLADEMLHRNNHIFAVLSSGRLFASPRPEDTVAIGEILAFLNRRMAASGPDLAHATANIGLLAYRLGHLEDGRGAYRKAMEFAERAGVPIIAAHASLFHTREAILAGAPWAREELEISRRHAKIVRSGGVTFYLRKLDALFASPSKAARILNPQSAQSYLHPHTQLPGLEFKITDDGPVILVPRHLQSAIDRA